MSRFLAFVMLTRVDTTIGVGPLDENPWFLSRSDEHHTIIQQMNTIQKLPALNEDDIVHLKQICVIYSLS